MPAPSDTAFDRELAAVADAYWDRALDEFARTRSRRLIMPTVTKPVRYVAGKEIRVGVRGKVVVYKPGQEIDVSEFDRATLKANLSVGDIVAETDDDQFPAVAAHRRYNPRDERNDISAAKARRLAKTPPQKGRAGARPARPSRAKAPAAGGPPALERQRAAVRRARPAGPARADDGR
jgi:hypothetical protein